MKNILIAVLFVLKANAHEITVNPFKVFTDDQVRDCYESKTHDGLRQPSIAKVNDTFVLFAECRNAPLNNMFSTLDDFTSTRIVFTTSVDGEHWSPAQFLLPMGNSKPKILYDRFAQKLVLQYNYFGESASARANFGLFQLRPRILENLGVSR
jgi:hypothetical protein